MAKKQKVQKGQLQECVFGISIQKRFTFTAPKDMSSEDIVQRATQLAGEFRIRDVSKDNVLNIHVAPVGTFQKE
ncbi:hypothetical protein KAR91_02520 [Candidatus Pacearchaeota archaeon]|nr:hypothetical protein [Candidatus Pacearchaeota archaeon]